MRVLGSSDLKFRSQIIIERENERIFDESKWKTYFNNQILVNFKRSDGNAVENFFRSNLLRMQFNDYNFKINFSLSISKSSGLMWINLYTWNAIAWEVYTSFLFLFMNNIPGKIGWTLLHGNEWLKNLESNIFCSLIYFSITSAKKLIKFISIKLLIDSWFYL